MLLKFLSIVLCLLHCVVAHAQQVKVAPVVINGYLSTIDTAGNVITDSIYKMDGDNMNQAIYTPNVFFAGGVFRLKHNGKFGFMDYRGHVISPFIFSELHGFRNGCAAVRSGNKWGCINLHGRYLADTIYDYVSDANEGCIILRKGESVAIIDTAGRVVMPFYYKTDKSLFSEPVFSCGLMCVMVRSTTDSQRNYFRFDDNKGPNWKIGFVNTEGRLVIDTIYSLDGALRSSEEDFHSAIRRGSVCGTGMANHNSYPVTYRLAGSYYQFVEGHCLVAKDGVATVIDEHGKIVVKLGGNYGTIIGNLGSFFTFMQAEPSLATYMDGENWLINENGVIVLHFKEDETIYRINKRLFAKIASRVSNRHDFVIAKTEVYDTAGHFLFQFYCPGYNFDERGDEIAEAQHRVNGKRQGFINVKGKFISRMNERLWLSQKNEGLMVAVLDDKYGFMTPDFHWVVSPAYEAANNFSTDLAGVKKNNKWGFIDWNGKIKIPFRYEFALSFQTVIGIN